MWLISMLILNVLIGFCGSEARAELVPIPGPPRIVYDTESGLDWLHLSETQGMTVNEMLAAVQPGGEFEGWQLGYYFEVGVLLAHGGMDWNGSSLDGSPEVIRDVLSIIGITVEQNDPEVGRTIGAQIVTQNTFGLPPIRIELLATADNDLVAISSLIGMGGADFDERFPEFAAALRRTHVPVPEPGGALSGLVALAGLLALRRR